MMRDRLVVWLRDASQSERLQLDEKLTLEKAVTKAQEAEAVEQQQPIVRGEEYKKPEMPVGVVQRGTPNWRNVPRQRGGATANCRLPERRICYRCGNMPAHARLQCPARDAICKRCGKRGLYQGGCKSAKVGVVREETDSQEDAFLGIVDEGRVNPWLVKVRLNGVFMEFQIDTCRSSSNCHFGARLQETHTNNPDAWPKTPQRTKWKSAAIRRLLQGEDTNRQARGGTNDLRCTRTTQTTTWSAGYQISQAGATSWSRRGRSRAGRTPSTSLSQDSES